MTNRNNTEDWPATYRASRTRSSAFSGASPWERIRRPGSPAATHTSKGATETGSSRPDNAAASCHEKGLIIILFVGGEVVGSTGCLPFILNLMHCSNASKRSESGKNSRGNQTLSYGDDNRQRDDCAQHKQSHQIDKIQRNAGLQNQYANL